MKTYQEIINLLKKQVEMSYMDGSSGSWFNVSQQFDIVATIYEVTEEQVQADVRNGLKF